MGEVVSRELCDKEHKRVNERLDHHERWLGEHEGKIDKLDRSDAKNATEIANLANSLRGQTKAIWGLVSMVAASLLGFFFYIIERGVFK